MENYFYTLIGLERRVCTEIKSLLAKHGAVSAESEGGIYVDFFELDSVGADEITYISEEGVVVGGVYDGNSIDNLVSEGVLTVSDVIVLVRNLRKL